MKLTSLFLYFTIILLMSCGNRDSTSHASPSNNQAKNSTSCLTKYAMEPCSIFDKEKIASLAGINPELITVKQPPKMKNPLYLTCTFEWDSDRTSVVKTALGNIPVDEDNKIAIGSFKILNPEKIKTSFPEYFEGYYKNVSEKDAAAFDKKMDEELKEESETSKSLGKSISKLALNFKYENINGIGDRASWETNITSVEGNLHVLHGNVIFSVFVNISNDVNESLELAKKVAKEIISLCEL